jgi:hypothetical protein
VSGYDGNSPYYVAGAFTVLNGSISTGEQDMTDATITTNDPISATGSSLSLVNGNIQIVLNTGDSAIGVNGVETFRGTTVSNARYLIEEFDTFATATGSLDAQTTTASPAGGYAFNLGGGLANDNYWMVIGGVLNINGAAVNVANSVFDFKDGSAVGQKQNFASGTVSAPDAFGRVVIALTPASTPALPAFSVAAYPVSTGQMQLVETDDALSADLGGMALGQGSNTGTFTQASVAGNSYAFGASGQDYITSNNGPQLFQIAGGLGLNANNTVTGAMAVNDLNFHFGANVTSGSYTVDPTGRVTVTATVTSGSLNNNPTFTFELYLDGNGNALEVGLDNLQASSGPAYVQQGSSDFEGNYALNVYGYSGINSEPAWSAAGPVLIASDNVAGYTDYSLQNAANSASVVTPNITLVGSENSANGTLHFTGLYAGDVAGVTSNTSTGYGYYPIDSRRVIAIEIDGQQLGLMMLEGVQPN